jgi:protein-S-isoprenylcysteine O-methyltransferase Ste14
MWGGTVTKGSGIFGDFPAIARIRAGGYERAVRDLGCAWFLLLAALVAWEAWARLATLTIGKVAFVNIATLVASSCLTSVYLSLSWFILHRPFPVARTDAILPSATALIGTYLPWSFMVFASDRDPRGANLPSLALLAIGTVGAVAVIYYLGRSFSIVPQARGLVREGPYSIVRHPLYLAEEVAVLGCLLRFFSPTTLALFLAHCALQMARIIFEEDLLRRTFPEYEDYARSTSRLIPHVW